MTDLLQEVDDMIRRERLEKIWHEHGNFIIGALVALILGTALFSAYKSWNAHVRVAQTQELMAAMEAPGFAAQAPEIAQDLRPGLKAVALLNAAAALLKDGKNEEALALFSQITQEGKAPADLAGYALIMQTRLSPAEARAALAGRLETEASSKSPWRFHAAMEAAVLKAAAGDYEAARKNLMVIIGAAPSELGVIPPGFVERARALEHIYALKSAENKAKQEG